MRILLTGATGYIGKRILPLLVADGHQIIAAVRDKTRLLFPDEWKNQVDVVECDFNQNSTLHLLPKAIDAAYYLIHSLQQKSDQFEQLELSCAENFKNYVDTTSCKQVIYLTGIVNEDVQLSQHLTSRLKVENNLSESMVPLTALRAGIIIGSGSASFEIIRDLAEKLPIMITPKWVDTRSQYLAIRNVLQFLTGVLGKEKYYNKDFDITGTKSLSYKEMLLGYAKVQGIKRFIFTVPIMTPKLSSYWLYFITSTNYSLASNLVDSMKVALDARPNKLAEELGIVKLSYQEAVELALAKIKQNDTASSWKDSFASSLPISNLNKYIEMPSFGCLEEKHQIKFPSSEREKVIQNIWSIGGIKGWYYANWMWKIRGYLDKLVGGVGLRRGRTNPQHIENGDALDFWRVLLADKEEGRLLLFAEMKTPGEAWLEFSIEDKGTTSILTQHAVFRPKGIAGRLYWYSLLPFHSMIFNGMLKNIVK